MPKYRIFDVCWKDPKNDKAKWQQIGVLMEGEDGRLKVKMNMIPVGWDGWGSVFERKEKEG